MKFVCMDHIRDGGSPDNSAPNDDWIGFDNRVAVVADGATGLADERLVLEADSDAQWIAKLGVEHFTNGRADDPVRELVREVNSHALQQIAGGDGEVSAPRHAWPTASFIMARLQSGVVEISGLGDCVAYVEMADGFIERFSALPFNGDHERKSAEGDLAENPAETSGIRTPAVLEKLRQKRSLSNTSASGVWTLGLVPEAADHVFTVALPVTELRSVLVMSDGFSAAVENYKIYDQRGLLAAAKTRGLAETLAEIRRVEHHVDPFARQFPRYKQSDDSSAILLEIAK